MKIIIDASFTDEEFIKFGQFLRDMWADKSDNCCVNIIKGTEDKTKEELLKIMREIFKTSPEYHEITITKEGIEEWDRKVGTQKK